MGGLLDKANQHQNVNQSVEEHSILIIEGGDDEGSDKNILIAMQAAGVVTFLISIFLLVQVGWLQSAAPLGADMGRASCYRVARSCVTRFLEEKKSPHLDEKKMKSDEVSR